MITKFEQVTRQAQRCSEDFYWDNMNALPPIYAEGCWGMGEPLDHTAIGEVITLWFAGKPEKAFCMVGTHREALAEFARVRQSRVAR